MQQVVSGRLQMRQIKKSGPRCAPAVVLNLIKERFYRLLSQLCTEDEDVSFYVYDYFFHCTLYVIILFFFFFFLSCTCWCGKPVTFLDNFLCCDYKDEALQAVMLQHL